MYIIQTLRDDCFEMKTLFAYEPGDEHLVIDESRCDVRFMEFLCGTMHAVFTRENDGRLTAPAHYHEVFQDVFRTHPYILNDEDVLRALNEEPELRHQSVPPPRHVA